MCQECGCGQGMDSAGKDGKISKNNTKTKNNICITRIEDNPDAHIFHTTLRTVTVERSVTEENDAKAHETWHALQSKGILCINIMGAPGSGKTTLIEGIANYLGREKMAVIQGDLESDVDKVRLQERGILTWQINTHSGCHLNAAMVRNAIDHLDLSGKEYLIIENVGNLVCPAGVKLGQHIDVVASSTAEGSDKPRKYPHIFRGATIIAITKYDLKEAVEFDEKMYEKDLHSINPKAIIVKVSKKEPASFQQIAALMEKERKAISTQHVHHNT